MASGKRIQQRGVGIRDLSFLEGLNQLKELDLWDQARQNSKPEMSSRPVLDRFSIPSRLHLRRQASAPGGVGIRDLSFLEGLNQLKELDLWDNDIEDLSPPPVPAGCPAGSGHSDWSVPAEVPGCSTIYQLWLLSSPSTQS
mgnify:CR=1 FL=1